MLFEIGVISAVTVVLSYLRYKHVSVSSLPKKKTLKRIRLVYEFDPLVEGDKKKIYYIDWKQSNSDEDEYEEEEREIREMCLHPEKNAYLRDVDISGISVYDQDLKKEIFYMRFKTG